MFSRPAGLFSNISSLFLAFLLFFDSPFTLYFSFISPVSPFLISFSLCVEIRKAEFTRQITEKTYKRWGRGNAHWELTEPRQGSKKWFSTLSFFACSLSVFPRWIRGTREGNCISRIHGSSKLTIPCHVLLWSDQLHSQLQHVSRFEFDQETCWEMLHSYRNTLNRESFQPLASSFPRHCHWASGRRLERYAEFIQARGRRSKNSVGFCPHVTYCVYSLSQNIQNPKSIIRVYSWNIIGN